MGLIKRRSVVRRRCDISNLIKDFSFKIKFFYIIYYFFIIILFIIFFIRLFYREVMVYITLILKKNRY